MVEEGFLGGVMSSHFVREVLDISLEAHGLEGGKCGREFI